MPSTDKRILFGLDFSGLAGFLLFLVLLLLGFIWLIYKLALIIIPATFIVLLGAGVCFVPFHQWSKATITARSERHIERCLHEIRALERARVPRREIRPFERRLREAAQTQIDSAFVRFRKVVARNQHERRLMLSGSPQYSSRRWQEQLFQERHLARELEELRLRYNVIPDYDPWRRFYHLHLQRPWIRWLVQHPRPATCLLGTIGIVLVTAVSAFL